MTPYEDHLLHGGAPFDPKYKKTIRQAIEAYQNVILHLRWETAQNNPNIGRMGL